MPVAIGNGKERVSELRFWMKDDDLIQFNGHFPSGTGAVSSGHDLLDICLNGGGGKRILLGSRL